MNTTELADKLAHKIVLLGEDEVASGMLTVKDFATGEQTKVPRAELPGYLRYSSAEPPQAEATIGR